MSVTIAPHGTPDMLSHQLQRVRDRAHAAMREAVRITRVEAEHLAPGRISEHIEQRVSTRAGEVIGVVFPTDSFAKYVEEGTGVYVEHHHEIRPHAQRRQQNPRAALRLGSLGIYRAAVKGQRGQHFMRRAAEHVEQRVITVLESVEPL